MDPSTKTQENSMMPYDDSTGHLRQANTRVAAGKLIDEWTFSSVFSKDPQYTARVHMIVEGGAGVRFTVTSPDFPKEKFEGSDLEKLRREFEAKMQEASMIASGAVWEDWLEIEVKNSSKIYTESSITGRSAQRQNARGIEISYQPIKRGTHPSMPGRVFTINSNKIAVDFPKPKAGGEYDELDERDLFGEKTNKMSAERQEEFRKMTGRPEDLQFAYIPDTAKNRAALDHLLYSMDALGNQLQAFLAASALKDNLDRLSGFVDPLMAALPAPSAPAKPAAAASGAEKAADQATQSVGSGNEENPGPANNDAVPAPRARPRAPR